MNPLLFVVVYGAVVFTNLIGKKDEALTRALSLTGEKGIINLGAGCGRTGFSEYICNLPEVVVNIDMTDPDSEPYDLEDAMLPFASKEFDVAFASHVLEHLNNWQSALDEWTRIADNVIIVLPHPLDITGILHPDHKQHFSLDDMAYIRQNWSAEVYC